MILKLGLDFDSGWLILDGIDELTTKTTVGVALFIKQPAVTEKQIGSNYNISHLVNFYQSSIDCDTYIKDFSDDTWRIFVDYLMKVKESYCEGEIGKGKGKKLTRVYCKPLTGTANFNFAIDWTKNIVK